MPAGDAPAAADDATSGEGSASDGWQRDPPAEAPSPAEDDALLMAQSAESKCCRLLCCAATQGASKARLGRSTDALIGMAALGALVKRLQLKLAWLQLDHKLLC